MNKLRLLLRSVYLKGQVDANKKTADMSWEDKIVEEIDTCYKREEFKLEYNKKLRTICIRFKDKLFYPQVCYHNTLHIEGKYLKFLVCNSCGKKWERCREYSKNTSYTFFRGKTDKHTNQ